MICEERVDTWTSFLNVNPLQLHYDYPRLFGFPFQMLALSTMAFDQSLAFQDSKCTVLLQERSPFSSSFVFAPILHKSGHISTHQMEILQKIAIELTNQFSSVYHCHLDVNPAEAAKRLRIRARPEESKLDFAKQLQIHEATWLTFQRIPESSIQNFMTMGEDEALSTILLLLRNILASSSSS